MELLGSIQQWRWRVVINEKVILALLLLFSVYFTEHLFTFLACKVVPDSARNYGIYGIICWSFNPFFRTAFNTLNTSTGCPLYHHISKTIQNYDLKPKKNFVCNVVPNLACVNNFKCFFVVEKKRAVKRSCTQLKWQLWEKYCTKV